MQKKSCRIPAYWQERTPPAQLLILVLREARVLQQWHLPIEPDQELLLTGFLCGCMEHSESQLHYLVRKLRKFIVDIVKLWHKEAWQWLQSPEIHEIQSWELLASYFQRPEMHHWTWSISAKWETSGIGCSIVSTHWGILHSCRVFCSDGFFVIDHGCAFAALKLHIRIIRSSGYDHTEFHVEKLWGFDKCSWVFSGCLKPV